MPGILCAVRGGPESRPTIEKAIQIAKEKLLPIHFLYVVNIEFLSHTISSRSQVINEDMARMGEFIVLTAVEHAEHQGVEAYTLIRHGSIGEEIISSGKEFDVDYVVLGKPKASTQKDAFNLERLMQFGCRITSETGAEVIYV